MNQTTNHEELTPKIIRKAVMGANIKNSPELLTSYGGEVPTDCRAAAELVAANPEEFRAWVLQRLSKMREIERFFGDLIRSRLNQCGILASPVMAAILDPQSRLEERLGRIRHIPGVREFSREFNAPTATHQGHITDRIIIDLSAEILALDLLAQLGFSSIRKIKGHSASAHPDIAAERGGKRYVVEVTRKKEVRGWATLPYGNLEDSQATSNKQRIGRLLSRALEAKNDQLSRAIDAGTADPSMIKTVAIKTSDYGFAQCIEEAEEIARQLLAEPATYPEIDCVWLIPNTCIEDSCWVCKDSVEAVFTQ